MFQDIPDAIPSNNLITKNIFVDYNIYQRDNGFVQSTNSWAATNSIYEIGNLFEVQQSSNITSASAFISPNTQLDYYLASFDMDFSNPSSKGIAYESLENLLDGIAPLKKTLLLDACHSGEIDKEEVELAVATEQEIGDVQFRQVGNAVAQKESHLGLQNTSELTKSLFTDLRKGTGATVISSAGGMEFAMESSEWQNGLFTYCLLHGLKTQKADLNKDGIIMLSELQQYVATQVTQLSNGKQQPTSRIENNVMDWRVW